MIVVSLAEVKAYLRIDGAEDDAVLAGLLRTATTLCEAFTGQVLLREARSLTVAGDDTEPDLPQGETVFEVFELPPLAGALPVLPQVWVAASGTGAGWRRAEVWVSRDAGQTWSSAGFAAGKMPIGTTLGRLAGADSSAWDETGVVEVELVSDAMWLESRSALSVLAGANLALIGNEIVQFRKAETTGSRRFLLSGLLRGRRAAAAEPDGHAEGERFVMLDPDGLFRMDQPIETIGSRIEIRLVPPNASFASAPSRTHRIEGRSLLPLAPAHLAVHLHADGAFVVSWIRRSRAGFGWIDFADAPLGEEAERYQVAITANGVSHVIDTPIPKLTMTTAEQVMHFGSPPSAADIVVRQVSGIVGNGAAAAGSFIFPR